MELGQPLSRHGGSLGGWGFDVRVRHPGQLFSGDATSDRSAGQEETRVFCRLQEKGVGLWWPRPREKGEGTKRTWVFFVTVGCPVEFTRQKLAATDTVSKGGRETKVEEKSPGRLLNGCGWKGQTARSTGSRWKLRIELTPCPARSSVYRTLVGFFGAQSAAGVGL